MKENALLKDQIAQLQFQVRKNNLRFLKIPEIKNENCDDRLIEILKAKIPSFHNRTLDYAYRQGKYRENFTRPIVCKFNHYKDKINVLSIRDYLGGKNIKVSEDLTKEVDANRKILLPAFRAAQQQGLQPKLIGDSIIINNKKYKANEQNKLPAKLRPEALSTPTEHGITAFYSFRSPLSNHYRCSFTVDDQTYNCMEQFFMMKKAEHFHDFETYTELLQETDPCRHKALGRKIANYEHKQWTKVEDDIIVKGLICKFGQNDNLKNTLLNTKDNLLVEASLDKKWGVGLTLRDPNIWDATAHCGQNKMGKLLMSVRAKLRN
jgi:ribA/ribD-fused uncharacterized protein